MPNPTPSTMKRKKKPRSLRDALKGFNRSKNVIGESKAPPLSMNRKPAPDISHLTRKKDNKVRKMLGMKVRKN